MSEFTALAAMYQNGELDQSFENVLTIAAADGYVLLPDRKYAKAKCESYTVTDLLLPVNLSTWGNLTNAFVGGADVFPAWFVYDQDKGYFTFTQDNLCRAFIRSRNLKRDKKGYIMDGEKVTAKEVKAALLRSLSIVRQDAGSFVSGTFEALRAMCPDTECPSWYTDGNINETALVTALIEKHGLKKAGSRIENNAGQFITPDMAKRLIAEEIGPYTANGTARQTEQILKLLKIFLPDKKDDLQAYTFTAADLAGEDIPPTPFVVNDILPCGLTILAAPPKTGKSWLCLALAEAVATGSTFWGYKVTQGAVLYLALEDNKGRLQKRLRKIGSRMPANLTMRTRNTMCLDTGLIDQLSEWISANPDTRLIILDTLQRVKGAAQYGLDAYAADYARLAPLQELATEKNVAIIAVHHFRKQGGFSSDDVFERLSGSTALFGASDCAWAIYGKRGAEEMTFHVTGRDVYDSEFKIKFDTDTSRWQMLGNSEQLEAQRRIDEYNNSPIVRTVRELVKEAGGRWIGSYELLTAEIMKRTHTVPAGSAKAFYNTVSAMQEQLLQQDGIAFTHGTGGRKGRDYTFETARQGSLL